MTTLHIMWRLIRFRPKLYLLNGFCALVYWFMMLLPGLIALQFFDVLAGKTQVAVGLWGLIVLLIMLELGRVCVGLIWQAIELTFALTTSALIRRNLFEHFLRKSTDHSPTSPSGSVISRFRDDVDDIVGFPGKFGLLKLMSAAISNLTAFFIMLHINVVITLFVFVPLILIVVATHQMRKRLQKFRLVSREATSQVVGIMGETFTSVQAIKIASAEKRVVDYIGSFHTHRRMTALQDLFFQSLLQALQGGIVNIGTGLLLLIAAGQIRLGTFTIGDFAFFVYNLGSVIGVGSLAGTLMAQSKQVSVSVDRLKTFLQVTDLKTMVAYNPIPMGGSFPMTSSIPIQATDQLVQLKISHLTYQYPGTQRGIRNAHLEISQGEFVVITGRIGSGKTTLLRTILGLLPKQQGELCWNGTVIEDLAAFFIPPRVAYTSQAPRLFSDTVRNNILLGLSDTSVDLTSALHLAVLEQDIDKLEERLETMVGPRGAKLSGGQIQRTASARMFVRNPEIYIFDDASTALDVETEKIFWDQLHAQPEKTFLVVSHRPATLRRANKILVLKDGQVIAAGPLDELLLICEEMRELWQTSFASNS